MRYETKSESRRFSRAVFSLLAAAYGDQRVATVTPFSNNATICSYPQFCKDNELPAGYDTARLDALFARANAGQAVDVPTGVGFCMYIRRAALQAVGLFDEEHFGKGYGEENDFCIRAAQAGWRNLHALDTFVRHFGGVSFGEAKSPRERAAMQTLRRLHPRYEGDVLRFVQADPAHPARMAVDVARILAPNQEGQPRPVILAVLHDRQGGTERHVHELAAALRERAQFIVLRPLPGQRVSLRLPDPDEGFELVFSLQSEYPLLLDVLRQFGVCHIHYHHLLGHGDEVRRLPLRLGVGYDFTARCHRSHQGRHAPGAQRHPDRRIRQELHSRKPGGRAHAAKPPPPQCRAPHRNRGRAAARHDALDQGQQAGGQVPQLRTFLRAFFPAPPHTQSCLRAAFFAPAEKERARAGRVSPRHGITRLAGQARCWPLPQPVCHAARQRLPGPQWAHSIHSWKTRRAAMHLLHFNMAAVSICCLLLLGGFSYRQSKPGVWAMLAGALGLLAVMAINIYATLGYGDWRM